jgi:hypothetical protein
MVFNLMIQLYNGSIMINGLLNAYFFVPLRLCGSKNDAMITSY